MREGSLEAPSRHPIAWRDEAYYDRTDLDAELRRTFDICHGCRRCFNLCDSFPRLFDLVDDSESGELDSVSSTDFVPVIAACTLCDLCFMIKCPYVPPHEFNLDFPHLMLRARAVEAREKGVLFTERQLTATDRNGRLAAKLPGLVNWVSKCGNPLTRPAMEMIGGVHRAAKLPKFHAKTLLDEAKIPIKINHDAPAFGRKAVLYATCFVNYNNPAIGIAARAVLARNGIETEVIYPGCCGMPQLEQGDIAAVAASAKKNSAELVAWIDKGYDIIALVPSCALMLKFEWPLILPENADVLLLSKATFDIAEYVADIEANQGIAGGMTPLAGGVTVHIACHARAQNMGQKAAEMLSLIPETEINVIERCSGHGGTWGIMKNNFEVALKVGEPVAREVSKAAAKHLVSECPLARDHIVQGMEKLEEDVSAIVQVQHPIELIARAYGI
jgi:glycerol-3-phosphate dehydrogenase subunit C